MGGQGDPRDSSEDGKIIEADRKKRKMRKERKMTNVRRKWREKRLMRTRNRVCANKDKIN